MSSRNRRLSPEERVAARCVPARSGPLVRCAWPAAPGGPRPSSPRARQVVAAEPLARLEYAEICDPVTLERVDVITEPAVLAVAIWVGPRAPDRQRDAGAGRGAVTARQGWTVSTMTITTPLYRAWAITVGPMRRSR